MGAKKIKQSHGAASEESDRDRLRSLALGVHAAKSGPGIRAVATLESLLEHPSAVIDRFEADGRRYLVAVEDAGEGEHVPERSLSSRERRVLRRRARGHALKRIAYDLDVSLATVSRDLASGTRKLGVGTARELPLVASRDDDSD